MEELAVLLAVGFTFCCLFHPISLVLPKETGWSPKEKRLWGGGAPVRFRDPPASPTRVGAATRPLRCPLRGRIVSLAPGARGLGWQKSGPVKVFCPAFLQKSGRGPGAEPLAARRSARNSLVLHKAQEGVKGGTLAGGSPFAGGPRRPQPMRAAVGLAVDEGKGRRGRRPLRVPAEQAACHGIFRVPDAAWEMVKTPPVRAAFSTFHLKYTNPEPLFSGYPSVQASAPQSGQVFPAARSSSM